MQTLDTHHSPLASELRDEISARTGAGEPMDAIEESLVERYGERIRAVPRGAAPERWLIGVAVFVLGMGTAMLAWFARRRRTGTVTATGTGTGTDTGTATATEKPNGPPAQCRRAVFTPSAQS